jgi:glycosyltransferase involved in cell wall biosynthesis
MIIKILVVGTILKTYGGHARFLEDLLNSELPYKFILFDPQRPPKDKSKSSRPGYQELFDAGIWRTFLGAVITLYHILIFPFILLKVRPALVHFAGGGFWRFWEYTIYIQMCRLLGIKTIYHWLANFDDFYKLNSPRARSMIKRILGQVDRHIVLSQLDKDCLDSLVASSKVYFLPGGVHASFIAQFTDQSITRKSGELQILFIGGRDPVRKGIFDVLKAYSTVVSKYKNSRLVLTGGGNVEDAIKQAADQEIMDCISFLSYVSESQKIDLYKSAAMLILPSYQEGLPYVILEALAAGLPVITTPVGGIPDVVVDDVNGFLIQPGDYAALAQKILLLCGDRPLRERMGQANKEKILSQYSEQAIFERLGRIYNELCCATS